MKKIAPLFVFALSFIPVLAQAEDLHYASFVDFQGGNLLLRYLTTESGEFYASCDMDTAECEDLDEEPSDDFDEPLAYPHTLSPEGSRAVAEIASVGTRSYWALFEVNEADSDFLSLLEFDEGAAGTSITYANDAAVFRLPGGTLVREHFDSGETSRIATGRSAFPFYSLSEHGRYASSYDYSREEQVIWDIVEGGIERVDANIPSYLVFSGDETSVAFLRDVDGFNKLFAAELDDLEGAQEVSPGDFTVVEYEFIDDTLLFIANVENDPLEWNLYAYSEGEVNVVEEGVAYDDTYMNLKKTSGRIFYQVVEGKNRMYVAYDPALDERVAFDAAPESETSDNVSREVLTLADRTAVLLSPEDEDDDLPLIVWLHGGPMRQTSLNFHPFFGYAVYDDVLERLAEEAYILKLDYSGSFGYGNEFLDSLIGNMGVLDVADVENAVEELEEHVEFDEAYLLGNSYGGYLSLKTLAESPNDFDGAISIAGVTDWYGLISRIPSSPFVRNFGGVPNNATFDEYQDASIYGELENVDNDTPMLLLYGENDATVPTWQSTEFYDFAKELDKNVEIVAYEDEGHSILKRDNLEDICERVADLVGIDGVRCEE